MKANVFSWLFKISMTPKLNIKFMYSEKATKFYEISTILLSYVGGFQLLDLIIPELKSHVILYKFKCSHWWKIYL